LPGASVIIRQLNIGAASNYGGRFQVTRIPVGTHTLEIIYLGSETKTIEITIQAHQNLNLAL